MKKEPDYQQFIQIPLRVNKQDQLQKEWYQVLIFDTPTCFTIKADSETCPYQIKVSGEENLANLRASYGNEHQKIV